MWTVLKQQIWRSRGILITIPAIAGGLLILRLAGALQFLELVALDQMFRLRPVEPVDSRIVLVTIDESDIKQLGQWPMSDAVLARAITALKQQQPKVIGLDIFRDLPVEPGHQALVNVFASTPNLIGVKKVIETAKGEVIQSPPQLEQQNQVSASDLVLDADGRIRRSLLSLRTQDNRPIFTLGAHLAFTYLEDQGISRQSTNPEQTEFRLGRATFMPLQSHDGGYAGVDAGGYQILSNFPKFQHGFATIPLTDVLQNRIPSNLIRDRIVIIGITAESLEDKFFTSTTTDAIAAPVGVEIHALLTSQLLSAALDGRSLLRTWSEPGEWLWIIVWATIGAVIGGTSAAPRRTVIQVLLWGTALLGAAYLLFLASWWVIIIPPLLALVVSAITSHGYRLWDNLREYARTLEQQVAERTAALQGREASLRDVYDQLRLREQELRLITDALPVCIFYTDLNQRYRFINHACEIWFNCSRDEILGKRNREFLGEAAYQVVEPYIQQVFGGQITTYEAELAYPSGHKHISATYIPDFDRDDQVRGYYGLILDISDRKRAEETSILEERNRMAREIHDTLAQSFTSIIVHLDAAAQRITLDPDTAQAHLKTSRMLARSGLADARRSVEALRPQILEEGDLPSALERFAMQIFAHTSVQVVCEAIGESYALPPEVETNLLRIGQEALTNVFKYANASAIRVELRYERSQCILQIKDNGQGFEPSSLSMGRGFGLLGMTERSERIGAELTIQSHVGQGTEVIVRRPTP
jgi:PAS domain S-box-containing protein